MDREDREPMGSLVSRVTPVGAHSIHARVSRHRASPAPPIVLVHGLIISSAYMVPTARRLAPFHTVLAPDLPGFGESGKPPRPLDVPELADVLEAWMGALGLDRAVLVGNSLGCQVVVDLAVRHPARVARAVLTGPTVDPRGRTRAGQAWRLLVDATRERPSLIPLHLRDVARAGLGAAWTTSGHALADRIEEKLPHVQVPTLVVRGERDPAVPQRWAEEVARLLPRGRLVVIPGASHAVNYSAPRELARLVREFVEEEVRAARARDRAEQEAVRPCGTITAVS